MTDELPDIDLEPDVLKPLTFEKNRRFETLIAEIIAGKWVLPNTEPMDPLQAIDAAVFNYRHLSHGRARIASGGNIYSHSVSALFFCDYYPGQGGGLTGAGFVMLGKHFRDEPAQAKRFHICQHKKLSTMPVGMDPRRGYSPGYCEICGFNMFVDSGD